MKKIMVIITGVLILYPSFTKAQLNSLGSYVWQVTDSPKVFNDQLQLSFVSYAQGFPNYGTVVAGGGYAATQDGGVFQIYFPYSPTIGGNAPKIRMGRYNNQGWSDWETFYTSANANSSDIDWTTKNVIAYGNILVGKTSQTNPAYRIDVNGDVRANKVVVNTTGADFVFDSTYVLPSLDSLNRYVNIHHHLPGIIPAARMQQEGMNIGEAYTGLLQKMEEMTRYIIGLNRQLEKKDDEINELRQRLNKIETRLQN